MRLEYRHCRQVGGRAILNSHLWDSGPKMELFLDPSVYKNSSKSTLTTLWWFHPRGHHRGVVLSFGAFSQSSGHWSMVDRPKRQITTSTGDPTCTVIWCWPRGGAQTTSHPWTRQSRVGSWGPPVPFRLILPDPHLACIIHSSEFSSWSRIWASAKKLKYIKKKKRNIVR